MTENDEQTTPLSAAWAQAPRACPDPSCAADDEDTIGLVMRAQRSVEVAALTPDDPNAAQFYWWCSACGLRWFNPPPPRPLVDLFLRALRFVRPEWTVQAGGTETILLSALTDLANR